MMLSFSLLVLVLCYYDITARIFPISFLSAKSSSSHATMDSVPIGLRNLANTCYMNSVLQSLFNSELANRLQGCKLIEGSTAWHLKNLYDKMIIKNVASLDTKPLASSMDVNINVQEDAEEFLLKLLEKLSLSVAEKGTLITDMFDFHTLQTIDCTRVPFSTSKKQKYTDLSLDISGKMKTSLMECLSSFFKPELLTGDTMYKTSLHGPQEAIKSIGMSSTPEELIIHLKRFSFDIESNNYAKVLTPVDIPLSLDLSRFVHSDASDDTKKSAMYDLSSVIVHEGDSLDYGHYTTLVRKFTADSSSTKKSSSVWYKINDHIVTRISEEEALTIARGSKSSSQSGAAVECKDGVCRRVDNSSSKGGSTASAYLVFYKKRN